MIEKNKNLRYANTFGLQSSAKYFADIHSVPQLKVILRQAPSDRLVILGGGSNVILPPSYPGIILQNRVFGIEILKEDKRHVILEVGGGVNWHELVIWSLRQGYGGLENLALIPGTVGAAPIQNIGAYGVELKDVLLALDAIELRNGQVHTFSLAECQFDYRNSYFKQEKNAGKFWLSKIKIQLTKNHHNLKLDYGAIRAKLDTQQIKQPTPSQVAAAVIAIRRAKLPDWRQLGNTGSFFKNPILSIHDFIKLQANYPAIPHYPLSDDQVKVPAGWLIEKSGWKGKRLGPVGCYTKQALVIVNHGGATQADVLRLRDHIQADVRTQFGVQLETEVNIISENSEKISGGDRY